MGSASARRTRTRLSENIAVASTLGLRLLIVLMFLISLLALQARAPLAHANPGSENASDGVVYSDSNGVSGNAISGLTGSDWSFAQPAAPDQNSVSHSGWSVASPALKPPANGNFWYPQYFQDKILFAHFVVCFNNNLPTKGCDTASQSIGLWDIPNQSYSRIDVPNKAGVVPVQGSISDIKIDPASGRIYYLGNPNYIGILNYQGGSTWIPGRVLSISDVCGSSSCSVGNELALLPTGDVVVTDWNRQRLLVFDGQLNLKADISTPDAGYILPLSVEASPICGARQGNRCVAGRFVVNFDAAFTNIPHPIQEYVWDARSSSLTPTSAKPVIPQTNVWLEPPGTGSYQTIDGSFLGVKYDSEGTLWVSTFNNAQPYSAAEVFAFVPKRDPSDPLNDQMPWQTYANSTCPRQHAPENYIVCRPIQPTSDPNSKPIFYSSGGFVDSLIQAGADMYWAGWAGRLDGVIRTNPGASPPTWNRDPNWPAQQRNPNACGSLLPPAARPDAYVPTTCPGSFDARGAIGAVHVPYSYIASYCPYGWCATNASGKPDIGDQLTHLVYDPTRNAIWTTIQSTFGKGCPDCPSPSNNVVLPQWLMRHNIARRAPVISRPTGSVSGNTGQQVEVNAQVYSNAPLTSATVHQIGPGGPVDLPLTVTPAGTGVYNVSRTIPVYAPSSTYQIIVTNVAGTDQTDVFDVLPVQTTSDKWYFAEGYLAAGWQVYLTLVNPDPANAAQLNITYHPEGSYSDFTKPCTIPANSRRTVLASDVLQGNGGPCGSTPAAPNWANGTGFGMTVTSTNGVQVIAERPTYFNTDPQLGTVVSGAHNVMGSTALYSNWKFAEGFYSIGGPTGKWAEFLTLSNPNTAPANATIRLLPESGPPPPSQTFAIPAGKRLTVPVTQLLKPSGPANPWRGAFGNGPLGFGVDIVADTGIIAERPTYYDSPGVIPGQAGPMQGGDDVIGTPVGRTRWTMAEGFVWYAKFQTYLTIANPTNSAIDYEVTYFLKGTAPLRKVHNIPANSRQTLSVGGPLGELNSGIVVGGNGVDVAFEVRATGDLVVERPVYFTSDPGLGAVTNGGHHTVATTLPRTEWRFAEGYKAPGFVEYITIQNPNLVDANVTVRFLSESGGPFTVNNKIIPANSRQTFNTGALVPSSWNGQGYGAIVSSTNGVPIVAERPMYFTQSQGAPASGGHNVLPLHIFGTNAAEVPLHIPVYAPLPQTPLEIVRTTGDITGTVGQPLVIEAEVDGNPDSVKVAFARPDDGVVNYYTMSRVGTTSRWVGQFTAAAPGVFQVIATAGNTTRVSPARTLSITTQAITGRVTAEDGAPLARAPVAAVTVDALNSTQTVVRVLTNDDGYYVAPVPEPGDYRLVFQPDNPSGAVPGLATRYTVHVNSANEWTPIPVPSAGTYYDEVLPKAGRIYGRITAQDTGQPLPNTSVVFFSQSTGHPVGPTAFTNNDGRYEVWLPPGDSYYGLVNSATVPNPLGWNGYSPVWSRAQIFDQANGGQITSFAIADASSNVQYDDALPPVYPVTGRVVTVGGPGLAADGQLGSYKAVSPNGQFWAVPLPSDGNYTYPLPNGDWKIIYIVPGYQQTYYHDTTDFQLAQTVTVSGSPVSLADQHVSP